MSFINEIGWWVYVVFYNLGLIIEDIIIDPCMRRLSRSKSLKKIEAEKYNQEHSPQATDYELNSYAK